MYSLNSGLFELLTDFLLSFTEKLRTNPKLRTRAWQACILLVIMLLGIWIGGLVFPKLIQYSDTLAAIVVVLGFIAGTLLLLILASYSSKPLRYVNKSYREKIAEAEFRLGKEPTQVTPAWDLARVTLEAYFNRNLSQITAIFYLSVVVMTVGFAVIIWGIMQAIQSPIAVASALITAIAGVITEFIGATFLFVYRSAIEQAINYSKTLERINSVGMAMKILDTMPDGAKADDLKSKTKASLVELLIQQAH